MRLLAWFAAVLLLLGLSVLFTWPLPAQLTTHVPGDQRDPLLNAALLHHVFRCLATFRWGDLFNPPFFFPHHNVLAFSESFLGAAWYGVPLWLLTPTPVALHNAMTVAGLFFSALAATLLGATVTGSLAAGLVAGVAYAFGPFHLVHAMHVQMHQAYGVPLVFLGLWWVVRGPRNQGWGWWLAAGALALQVLACSYLGLFTAALAVPVVVAVVVLRGRALRGDARHILGAAFLALLVAGPPLARYQQVQEELGFRREISEIRHFSTHDGASGVIPPGLLLPPRLRTSDEPEGTTWPGRAAPWLTYLGLAALLLEALYRRTRRRDDPALTHEAALVLAAVLLALLSVWLSRGPGPGGPSLAYPYSLLHAYVPGFTGLRVPSRFFGLTLLMYGLGAAVVAGRLARLPWRGAPALALGVAVACGLDVWPRRYPTVPLPDGGSAGPVLMDLARSDNPGPVAELPYRLYWRSAQNVLNPTRHGRVTTNGYSGVEPPLALALRYLLPSFPLSRTDELVRHLGVRALVLHRGPPRADPGERAPFLEEALRAGALPDGFSLRLDRAEGAWFDVTPAQSGPLADVRSLWTAGVQACAAPGAAVARVDMPLSSVVVSATVRHRVEVDGARALMTVPPVGMLDTLVGAVPVPAGARAIRLRGTDRDVPLVTSAPGGLAGVSLTSNLPGDMRTAQGLWLRVEVLVASGSVPARVPGSAPGVEVRLGLEGIRGEVRPSSLPLRTTAAPGCPGVAEGVVEFVKGSGTGALRLVLVAAPGGPALAQALAPLTLH
jgi:hypothetical protein